MAVFGVIVVGVCDSNYYGYDLMNNYIVSFRGKMKVGKTTAAEILQSIEPSFQKVSFATAMKIEAVECLMYAGSYLEKDSSKVIPWFIFEKEYKKEALCILQDTTPHSGHPGDYGNFYVYDDILVWASQNKDKLRPWFQWYGEYKRKENPYHWIKKLLPNIADCVIQGINISIDDCRYENEREFLEHLARAIGYKYIDVYISNPELKALEGIKNHKSEQMNSSVWFTGKEDFSKHLTNIPSHGIEEYRSKIEELWKTAQLRIMIESQQKG